MTDEAEQPARRRRTPRVGRTGARFPRMLDPVDDRADSADSADGADDPVETVVVGDEAGSMVGRTGARFGSRARRVRREAERIAAEDAAVPRPVIRLTPVAPGGGTPTGPDEPPPFEADLDDRVWVRPYVRTRGRTRARTELAIETLISLPTPHPLLTDHEHRAIGEICRRPVSVAEVAARLGVPLGVARVLIDDMAVMGLVRVHPRPVASSGAPDVAFMQRVLDGLNRL